MRVESLTLHPTTYPFWLFDLGNKVLDIGSDDETKIRSLRPCGGFGLWPHL